MTHADRLRNRPKCKPGSVTAEDDPVSSAPATGGHLAGTSAADHRSQIRARILRGARKQLAVHGLSVRVEDIAAAAGVSRRTVFRYFETHEALLAGALAESMRSYGDHLPRPRDGDDLERWLRDALVAVHRMNAQHGRVYFELASSTELHGELATIADERRTARAQLVSGFTKTAWRLGGGQGRAPVWLHDAMAVLLSTFATEALGPDFGRTPDQVGTRLAHALAHAVRGAVAERGSRVER